jgi:hypothetical protein
MACYRVTLISSARGPHDAVNGRPQASCGSQVTGPSAGTYASCEASSDPAHKGEVRKNVISYGNPKLSVRYLWDKGWMLSGTSGRKVKYKIIQGDQKVFVYLIIIVQKTRKNILNNWVSLTNITHWWSLLYSIRGLLHVSASMCHLQGASYVLMSYLNSELVMLFIMYCVHTFHQHSQYMTNNITNSVFK